MKRGRGKESALVAPWFGMPSWFFLLPLLGIFSCSVAFRIHEAVTDSISHPPFNRQDDTGYYWSEGAFQYRYAKLVAQGQSLPELDKRAEHPDGLLLKRDMTLFMEPLCGWLYRIAFSSRIPFHLFAIWFVAAASSITIFPVFFLVRSLTKSNAFSAIAAAYYALNPSSYSRAIGTFEYENFALPIFFVGVAALYEATYGTTTEKPSRSRVWTVLAIFSLLTAIVSWHFAAFLIFGLLFILSAHMIYLGSRPDAPSGIKEYPLLAVGCSLAVAFIAIPDLREKMLPFSWVAATIYGYWLYAFIRRLVPGTSNGWRGLSVYMIAVAAMIGFCHWLNPRPEMYSHVSSLLASKLKFFFIKPSNPALLPFEARTLWIESLKSPMVGEIAWFCIPAIMITPLLLLMYWRRIHGTNDRNELQALGLQFACLMGLFSLGLYMTIERLSVVFAFFLAVLLGAGLNTLYSRNRMIALSIAIVLLGIEGAKAYNWDSASPNAAVIRRLLAMKPGLPLINFADELSLARWIKLSTNEDDPILAAYQTSPLILTWTGRPIILHPKFESATLRRRFEHFLESLYGSEDDFHRFAVQHGAKYVVYQVDLMFQTTDDSYRFQANRLTVPSNSAATKFHFFPDSLTRFDLVYQNPTFRVFRIREQRDATRIQPFYHVWYDPKAFNLLSLGAEPQEAKVRDLLGRLKQEAKMQALATAAIDSGVPEPALSQIRSYIGQSLQPARLTADIGVLEFISGNSTAANQWLRRAIAIDRNLSYSHRQLAVVLANSGYPDEAVRLANIAVALDPLDAGNYSVLGSLYGRRGDYRKALKAFEKALELGSEEPSVKSHAQNLKRRLG